MIIYESRKHRRNIHLLNTKERWSSGKDHTWTIHQKGMQDSTASCVWARGAQPTASLVGRLFRERELRKAMVSRHMA